MANWSPRSLALRAACLVACLAAAYGASDDHGDDDHGPCHGDDHGDDHGGHHGGEFHHFNVIFFTVIFVIIVWVAGKAATAVGNPALVGEIVAGVILGPHLLDFVPNAAVLKVIGEVGLVLHALEVGLMVDVELLEIIGARGIGVGVFGSALPMGLSWLTPASATSTTCGSCSRTTTSSRRASTRWNSGTASASTRTGRRASRRSSSRSSRTRATTGTSSTPSCTPSGSATWPSTSSPTTPGARRGNVGR